MTLVERIITGFLPIDSYDKIDSLITKLKESGVRLEGAVDLKIRFIISDRKVLGYYLAKYFGQTPGNIDKLPHSSKKKNKKVFYGCKAQDAYIKKNKEERKKRLSTTDEEWRKMKHKLPTVEFEGDEKVKYLDKTHIIYTPMGNKR